MLFWFAFFPEFSPTLVKSRAVRFGKYPGWKSIQVCDFEIGLLSILIKKSQPGSWLAG